MNKKVELLSPAGNYEALIGALNAGADAVYLGGEKYGARAYADNFTTEEIYRALHAAHFMGRKIYLTVNTLCKENEAAQMYDYLLPFYKEGLDGVIIQDLGVFCLIREWFPELPLHVSTQMTVTGAGGASFLKEQGAARIVPARELSLSEVRSIKEETGVEIECFIHGAMCYSYSGQCLFSGILGGRSGNRGRCAQPCRLPYQIYEDHEQVLPEQYPLSLKDMCTLEYIPQLIEAGIDSFKIEGRMKRPEYAAGVTAVYRKYIDLYYRRGADGYKVEQADMDRLRGLYIRSELQTGYYERHNGKEMITLSKPGYAGSDEHVIEQIREDYLCEPVRKPVCLSVKVKAGEPVQVSVREAYAENTQISRTGQEAVPDDLPSQKSDDPIQIEIAGDMAQEARNAPLTVEDIRKQMMKTGNSCVTVSDCEIHMEGNVFVPVRALNQLRRDAIEAFEREVILQNGLLHSRIAGDRDKELYEEEKTKKDISRRNTVDCLVTTYDQFVAVMEYGCARIFIESDLFMRDPERIVERIRSSRSLYDRTGTGNGMVGTVCYLALPYILRKQDEGYLRHLTEKLKETDGLIAGFLLRSLEGLSYVRDLEGDYAVIPDTGLYCFHTRTLKFWKDYGREYTIPYELNAGEAAHLAMAAEGLGMRTTLVVYGRIPMMITANCLRKTAGICPPRGDGKRQIYLMDRCQTAFPAAINCEHCYNIIYNSVPYSLHTSLKEAKRVGADVWRYDFVMETGAECQQILAGKFPFAGYTAGHLKRGVE